MSDEAASGASLASSEQGKGASEASTRPVLHVVRGDATPEELAALVAVVASLSGGGQATPRPTPEWSHHRRKVRTTFRQAPGGWRASALPR